ncbi:unnamed protein product [Acanthoscelides obtectus]|nr:unnamed protein product [Acanthoscelides obtectus]CAK1665156.1 Serine/arginine-rich splicing factor 2 [Acanthoscelides obtectus]
MLKRLGFIVQVFQCIFELHINFCISKTVHDERFYDKRDAEDALDAMDGRILDGRELRVQMARYGRPTSPRNRYRGGGGRRR